MTKQLDFFREPRKAAQANPRTFFISDGTCQFGSKWGALRFRCQCCGHESDWLAARSPEQEKGGRVCPKCKGRKD